MSGQASQIDCLPDTNQMTLLLFLFNSCDLKSQIRNIQTSELYTAHKWSIKTATLPKVATLTLIFKYSFHVSFLLVGKQPKWMACTVGKPVATGQDVNNPRWDPGATSRFSEKAEITAGQCTSWEVEVPISAHLLCLENLIQGRRAFQDFFVPQNQGNFFFLKIRFLITKCVGIVTPLGWKHNT